MTKTVINVWFKSGSTISHNFEMIEFNGAYEDFTSAWSEGAVIDGIRLHTRRVAVGIYEVTGRTPKTFSASAIGIAERSGARISEAA